jgi:hypothetical protein
MLPIEPVFQNISRTLSSSDYAVPVDVPSTSTICFLRSLAPTHSSAASSLKFDLTPSPSHRSAATVNDEERNEISQIANLSLLAAPRRKAPAPPVSRRITTVGDESRDETSTTANIPFPAAPTRHAPVPPPMPRPSIANLSSRVDTFGVRPPSNTLHHAIVPDPIVEQHGERSIDVTLGSRIRYWIKYPGNWASSAVGSLGKLAFLFFTSDVFAIIGVVAFQLATLAGPGYLIYYIVKKTSLPLYAKVLASIAAGMIPSIPILYVWFFPRRRRRPQSVYARETAQPAMEQLDPSWLGPSRLSAHLSVESNPYVQSVNLPTDWSPQPVEQIPYSHHELPSMP